MITLSQEEEDDLKAIVRLRKILSVKHAVKDKDFVIFKFGESKDAQTVDLCINQKEEFGPLSQDVARYLEMVFDFVETISGHHGLDRIVTEDERAEIYEVLEKNQPTPQDMQNYLQAVSEFIYNRKKV